MVLKKLHVVFKWSRLRLHYKLLIIYIPLIILPAVLGMFLITNTFSTFSRKTITQYSMNMLNLTVKKINERVIGYEKLSKQFLADEQLCEFLSSSPETEFDRFDTQKNVLDRVGLILLGDEQNNYVESVVLTTPGNRYVYGEGDEKDFGVDDPDYKEKVKSREGAFIWFIPRKFQNSEKSFTAFRLARVIRDKKLNEVARLTIVIDESAITDIFEQVGLYYNMGLYLYDDDNLPILSYGKTKENTQENSLNFIVRSSYNGWNLSAFYPLKLLNEPIGKMTRLSLIIILVFILLGITGTYVIAINLIIPMRKLLENIKRGADNSGQFQEVSGTIEVVEINNTFVNMVKQIHHLAQEVIANQKKKQEAEIRVLQNQLSPHFLYNTLNSIRWMAMIQRQDNIKDMTDSLMRLFTYSIRDMGEPASLKDELEILKDYVKIQKVRYHNFSMLIDIKKELYGARILKFLLQPLIENSIVHGLAETDRTWEIIITGNLKDQDIHIAVKDNGIGMSREDLKKVNEILSQRCDDKNHIGLRSVHERIQLNYGKAYGISIKSEPGEGTCVHMILPFEKYFKEEAPDENSNDC